MVVTHAIFSLKSCSLHFGTAQMHHHRSLRGSRGAGSQPVSFGKGAVHPTRISYGCRQRAHLPWKMGMESPLHTCDFSWTTHFLCAFNSDFTTFFRCMGSTSVILKKKLGASFLLCLSRATHASVSKERASRCYFCLLTACCNKGSPTTFPRGQKSCLQF